MGSHVPRPKSHKPHPAKVPRYRAPIPQTHSHLAQHQPPQIAFPKSGTSRHGHQRLGHPTEIQSHPHAPLWCRQNAQSSSLLIAFSAVIEPHRAHLRSTPPMARFGLGLSFAQWHPPHFCGVQYRDRLAKTAPAPHQSPYGHRRSVLFASKYRHQRPWPQSHLLKYQSGHGPRRISRHKRKPHRPCAHTVPYPANVPGKRELLASLTHQVLRSPAQRFSVKVFQRSFGEFVRGSVSLGHTAQQAGRAVPAPM